MRIFLVTMTAILVCTSGVCAQRKPAKEEFEKAVDRGLEYLKQEQEADGSWRGMGGPFGRGGSDPAVTSLCVMAYLSAGHVPGEGPYGSNVEKGVQYVLGCQQRNGLLTGFNFGQFEMYQHGICTLMLAEVVGMMPDRREAKKLREKLELAVAVILKAQLKIGEDQGGWRYRVQSFDADISVTGWQVMALRAAKNVGCDVPAQYIDKAIAYIRRCNDPNTGGYRYQRNGWLTVPCTGASILSLALADKDYHKSPEALRGGAFLLKTPQNLHQHLFYGVYYTSQAMFQLSGNYWENYRKKLHQLLLRDVPPRQAGNWQGPGGDDAQWGSHYCTAMAILALTVEYRFLPIYQRNEEEERPVQP